MENVTLYSFIYQSKNKRLYNLGNSKILWKNLTLDDLRQINYPYYLMKHVCNNFNPINLLSDILKSNPDINLFKFVIEKY